VSALFVRTTSSGQFDMSHWVRISNFCLKGMKLRCVRWSQSSSFFCSQPVLKLSLLNQYRIMSNSPTAIIPGKAMRKLTGMLPMLDSKCPCDKAFKMVSMFWLCCVCQKLLFFCHKITFLTTDTPVHCLKHARFCGVGIYWRNMLSPISAPENFMMEEAPVISQPIVIAGD